MNKMERDGKSEHGNDTNFCLCLSLHSPSKVFKDQVCLVPYLSPCPLVLLGLQEIQQYLKQCGVLPVGLHHIASAGHQLPQGP